MTPSSATGAHFDLVFGAQATFRVLLDAMARPGERRQLPAGDPVAPLPEASFATALLQTLLDHEVTFAVVPASDTDDVAVRIAVYLAEVTGSRPAAIEEADYVLALGPLPAGLAVRLKRGVPAFPDESATLIRLVSAWSEDNDGTTVTLSGPGVPGSSTVQMPGMRQGDLTALAAANAEPPCGVDLILVGGDGEVLCLPRSTKVVLARGAGGGLGAEGAQRAPG